MKLADLILNEKFLAVRGNLDVNINYLSQSTLDIQNNCLFFCYKGISGDGHEFIIKQLNNKNISALVVERFLDEIDVPQILVKNTRRIMPKLCNKFFNNVLKKVKLIGVTGTNGKTTTCHIIYDILCANNYKVGLIGTNGTKYLNKKFSSNLTTPDTIEFFKTLNCMVKEGVNYVVMEVSAHALSLNKLLGCKFEIGVFTNLTQDHLDYFKSMHNYALTKLKFLSSAYCKTCLINIDDDYGQLFAKLCKTKMFTYGLDNPANIFALNVKYSLNNTTFVANILDNIFLVSSNLLCKFNVYNLLSAMSVCKLLGLTQKQIEKGITSINSVDGRLNFYKLKNDAYAIIDFAHTPDGLQKVLLSLKEIAKGKVLTVFGCGGNRDSLKRGKMGEIATKLSDFVVITSDNPRNEAPKTIINAIVSGAQNNNYCIEEDRTTAILKAIKLSNPQDFILIAGKGAENYQEINNVKMPYNDFNVIKPFLK